MPPVPAFDLIAIGDSALNVFLHIHEATLQCQLHREQCLLCLEYANKIPVQSVTKVPGSGSGPNIALGAAKLGMKSAIVTTLGNDEVAQEILRAWKKHGVSDVYVRMDSKHETDYATVLDYAHERTILAYNRPKPYALPAVDGATWVVYAAVGKKHERMEKQLLAHLKKNPEQKLAFNPGIEHMHRNLDALKPVIARSDLFIVNEEEAIRLLEDGDRPLHNLLLSFHHLGAKIVVITDGKNGSYATDGHEFWSCPIFPGKAVESTGAGDAFATGFIYALHHKHSIQEAMRYGTANSWSVIQKIGAHEGQLSKKIMATVLKKFNKIQPRLEPSDGFLPAQE
ncbi:MAG: carbohydrate kinase family protein [bacterium]|nr:carbohydrate kinase family protein [bacterium]